MADMSSEFIMDFPAYKQFLEQTGAGDNRYQRERMKLALQMAIKQALTYRQREIMIYYYFEEQSVSEIAQCLSLNKSTVSRHLKRAREKLKIVLNYGLIAASGPVS